MAVSAWHAVVFVGIAACSPYGGGAFHCERDDQCTGGGTCQLDGLCSFADPGCPSGQRYGDLAGGLSNSCVMGGVGRDAAMQDGSADGSIDATIDGRPRLRSAMPPTSPRSSDAGHSRATPTMLRATTTMRRR